MIKRTVSTEQIAQWCNADTGEIACAVEPRDIAGQGEPVGYITLDDRGPVWRAELGIAKFARMFACKGGNMHRPVYLSPPLSSHPCPGCAAALAAQRKAEQAASDFEDHAKQSERRTSLAEKRAIAAESRAAACERVVEAALEVLRLHDTGQGHTTATAWYALRAASSALPSPATHGDAPAIEFPDVVEAVVSRDEPPAPERTCETCSVDDAVCDAVLVENRKLHAMVATLRRCAECGCCAKESCDARDMTPYPRSVQGWADPRALTEVPFRCAVVIGSPGCNHTFVPVTVTWIPTGEPK
jgi:hypothetical protein